jgi:hypothetical protein
MPGSPERKTCWRNLRCPAEVDVWLAGRKYRGTALALEGPERKEELAEAIDTYTTRFPRARKQLGVTEVRGATTNAPTVMMVSIDLQDETLHDAPP